MAERLFFALWPEPAARQAFQALMGGLPHHGGREPHPEDLHLTLVFLGECRPVARTCAEAVAAGTRGTGFDLGFDQVGYWPRPQILWCEPSTAPPALMDLVAALSQGLRRCGFEPERRPYAPHLTVARRAHPVAAYRLETPLPWPAREFMALALRALDKDATVVMDAVLPSFLQPFPAADAIVVTTEVTDIVDAVLVMECSPLARCGVAGLDRSPVINIDHHPGNAGYGTINRIDEGAAACGELVFTLIDMLGVSLTPEMATHLYLAILTDTGSFHFSHLTPRTYELAGRAVAAGADPQWIARTRYGSSSLARVRIFGAVLNGMTIHADGRVALLTITQALARDLGGTYDDTEGLINFPLTVRDIHRRWPSSRKWGRATGA